jgi:hypothetical protein
MRLDLAADIKVGDTVYNCFMDALVVTSIYHNVSEHTFVFSTIDTRLNRANYAHEDIYLSDLADETDDEKSWVSWAKDNKDFFDTFDHIETMKEIYKVGFCKGFEHKQQISFEEQMQK